jgi:hypothetical protein
MKNTFVRRKTTGGSPWRSTPITSSNENDLSYYESHPGSAPSFGIYGISRRSSSRSQR